MGSNRRRRDDPRRRGWARQARRGARNRGQGLRRDDERSGLGEDQLQLAGWSVEVANARKVRDVAPLACKTDKVDARVLAELRRRDLLPSVWVASPEDRAISERLRRRAHLVKLHLASKPHLRPADAVRAADLSSPACASPTRSSCSSAAASRGSGATRSPSTSTRSISCSGGSARSTQSFAPIADSDPRAKLLQTIPGVGPLIGLTLRDRDRRGLALPLKAREAGRLCRPGATGDPVGRALGDRAAIEGRLADPALGGGRGGQSGLAPESNPFHEHYRRLAARHGTNPAKVSVARKLLICSWHMLSRGQVFKPSHPPTAPASSSRFQAA